MKIELTNFRCHTNKIIEIPNSGLIAISGDSGVGKSTILSSIVYALYGVIPGKYKKPYTMSLAGKEKTCKVVIRDFLGNYTVTRTSSPNTVILENSEDENSLEQTAAQSKIISLIGMDFDKFLISSYIVQNINSSVLSMTPTEQINFINTLVNSSSESYKEKTRDKIKSIKESITSNSGALNMLTQQLLAAEAVLKKTEKPQVNNSENINSVEIKEKISELEEQKKIIAKEIKTINSLLEESRKSDKLLSEKLDKINKIRSEISVISDLRANLENVTQDHIKKSEKKINELTDQLDVLKDIEEYYDLMDQYKKSKEDYLNNLDKELKVLKDKILTSSEFDKITQQIKNEKELLEKYDKYISVRNRREKSRESMLELSRAVKNKYTISIKKPSEYVKFLKVKLDNCTKAIQVSCPKCNENLLYKNGKLIGVHEITHSDHFDDDFQILEKYLIEFEELKKDCSKKELLSLYDSKFDNLQFRKEHTAMINNLEFKLSDSNNSSKLLEEKQKGILPDYITAYLEKANQISEELPEESKGVERSDLKSKISEMEKLLDNESKNGERLLEIKRQYDEHTRNLDTKNKILKGIGNLQKDSKTSNLEESLTNQNNEILNINETIMGLQRQLNSILLVESYNEKVNLVKSLKKSVEDNKKGNDQLNSQLEAANILEKFVKESEVLSLENMVNIINNHAKIYLDEMFANGESIIVQLKCTSENKKGVSLKMNTYLYYKGYEYDDIEALSGGERQRCNMAYLLAINEILNSKILMLDECLNNLDETMNTEILQFVKGCANKMNKLILVVSHEANKGNFDEVIEVESSEEKEEKEREKNSDFIKIDGKLYPKIKIGKIRLKPENVKPKWEDRHPDYNDPMWDEYRDVNVEIEDEGSQSEE